MKIKNQFRKHKITRFFFLYLFCKLPSFRHARTFADAMHVPTDELRQVRVVTSEEKQSLSYLLRSGFAGGLAGAAAKTAVAPLDRGTFLPSSYLRMIITDAWYQNIKSKSCSRARTRTMFNTQVPPYFYKHWGKRWLNL